MSSFRFLLSPQARSQWLERRSIGGNPIPAWSAFSQHVPGGEHSQERLVWLSVLCNEDDGHPLVFGPYLLKALAHRDLMGFGGI